MSNSQGNNTASMDTEEKKPSAPSGMYVIRSDGTRVEAGGSGQLAAQIKAGKTRKQMTVQQQKQETITEQQAMITIRLDNGQVVKADPTTEEGRQLLLKYNQINIYRSLSPEDAAKIPLHVRAANDRIAISLEQMREYFIPHQYVFPPDEEALRSRLLYSDATLRMQAVANGCLNFVMHVPRLIAMVTPKKPVFFHELSHAVYAFYFNWMFMLNASMPSLNSDEIDGLSEAMGDAMKAFQDQTGKMPADVPVVPCEIDYDRILVMSVQEAEECIKRGVGLYKLEEEELGNVDETCGDAQSFVRFNNIDPSNTDAMVGHNLYRDVTEEDLENWAKQINDATRILAHNAENHEASQNRAEALNKLSRFIFYCIVKQGGLPEAWAQKWQQNNDAKDAIQSRLDDMLKNEAEKCPPIAENLPRYVQEMFEGDVNPHMFRIALHMAGPPPPSDWRSPAHMEDDDIDMSAIHPPEDVARWQQRILECSEPKKDVVEFYRKKGIIYDQLHGAIRVFHMMNRDASEPPDWVNEWIQSRLVTSVSEAPKWFRDWWRVAQGSELEVYFPSWMTHFMFRGVHTLSVMSAYYKERCYLDHMISEYSTRFINFMGSSPTHANYLGVASAITTSMVYLTKHMLTLLEKTVVALLGQSIPVDHADVFLTPDMVPIVEFYMEDDPETHWKAQGSPESGPDYLNIQKTEELRKTQNANVETMSDALKGSNPYEKLVEIETAVREQAENNPVTLGKRGDIMLQMIYTVAANADSGMYNNIIRRGASRLLLELPATHKDNVRNRLIEAYKNIQENREPVSSEDLVVLESVEQATALGKRRAPVRGTRKKKR